MRLIVLFVAILFAGAGAATSADYEIIGGRGAMTFVKVSEDVGADRAAYRDIADVECEGKQVCFVQYFVGRDSVSFPFSDEDLAAQVASYNRNLNTGNDELLLACRLDPDPNHCFEE